MSGYTQEKDRVENEAGELAFPKTGLRRVGANWSENVLIQRLEQSNYNLRYLHENQRTSEIIHFFWKKFQHYRGHASAGGNFPAENVHDGHSRCWYPLTNQTKTIGQRGSWQTLGVKMFWTRDFRRDLWRNDVQWENWDEPGYPEEFADTQNGAWSLRNVFVKRTGKNTDVGHKARAPNVVRRASVEAWKCGLVFIPSCLDCEPEKNSDTEFQRENAEFTGNSRDV
ncbi:hypothetical protein BD410DRAFT_808569 [Rickenella mellea]|uniref:Uncharacterized protein n=1 Tax=Rickenella mellea TaxID=50990 RepID=A0A4Y7PLZ2_9AGAM|nr:hypothetical protein BD410DRAFT_808569 [Rickenella mellea]